MLLTIEETIFMKKLLVIVTMLYFFASCENTKSTSKPEKEESRSTLNENTIKSNEEKNKAIALTCIRAWSNGNIDEIVKHLAQNTADLGDGSTPPARGIDSVKYFMQMWNSSVKDYKSDNELAVSDGDYVFVYAGWSGTFKNDFMGMKTKGKSFNFKDVDIFKFNNENKISEHRAVHFSTVLRQLALQTK
jgi:predicted ester cyclase